jgi:hypothetical protein
MKEKTLRIFVPGILSALAILLAIACTDSSPKSSAEISLKFDFAANRGPGTAADMDCFLVNIRGAGVVATYPLVDFGDGVTSSCLDLGTVSTAVSVSDATTSGIRMPVKTGKARTIEVLGFEGLGTCAGKSLKELLAVDGAELYKLGSTTTDIFTNRTVAIENSYVDGTTPDKIDDCEESGGANGPARVYRYYSGNYYDLGLRATAIHALHVNGGNLFIGGDFADGGGNTDADNFAIYNISGQTFAGFAPVSGPVLAITQEGANVYVGGAFLDAGGNTFADRVARWSGAVWSGLGTGVDNGQVNALATMGGNVYVGGTFSSVEGNLTLNSLARFSDLGNNWNQVGSTTPIGAGKEVRALMAQSSLIFIGGSFTDAGANVDADNIALYNGGSIVQAVGSGAGLNGAVNALATISGTDFYATGSFSMGGGKMGIAQFITGTWEPLGTGFSGTGYALATVGSYLFLGGSFTSVGGVASTENIGRWGDPTWNDVGMGLNGAVKALATDGSNVFVGGDFTSNNGGSSPTR